MNIELNNQEFYVQSRGCFIQLSTVNSKEYEDYFFIVINKEPIFIGRLCRYKELSLDIDSIIEYIDKGESFPFEYGYFYSTVETEVLESLLSVILINKLIELETSSIPYSEYLSKKEFSDFDLVVNLANEVLINKGEINWNNSQKLKDIGLKVLPGNLEGFTCVIGILVTNKGRIPFG